MKIVSDLSLTGRPIRRAAMAPRLVLDFMDGALPAGVTFTRAGSATYFDAAGVLQTALADVPRFDHDPVTLQPRGLLIEGSRTNLLLRSEEFDNAAWGKVAGSVTANATTAPTGAATADQFTEDTSTGQHDVRVTASFVGGTTYTFSVFAKANGRQLYMLFPIGGAGHGASFDLVGGTVTSASASITAAIVPVGGGWFRCSVTATATGTGNVVIGFLTYNGASNSFAGDGVSGFYLFGAQLEAGAFPTSYIPTTTTAATRAADTCWVAEADFSRWFNPIEGTVVVEFWAGALHSSRNYGLWNISPSGTYGGDVMAGFSGSGAAGVMAVNSGGVGQAYITGGNFTPYAVNRMAAAYKANDFARSINGGAVLSDTSGAIPAGLARLDIGKLGASFEPLDGHIRRIRYWPTRLSNAQLQELTA